MEATKPKVRKYQRLEDRRNELSELADQAYQETKDPIEYYMEMDCIDHLFECEGIRTYGEIASFCEENGINRVVDIGCAYGHQSECFLLHNIDYVGINEGRIVNFWNQEKFAYISDRYPCSIPVQEQDLGISVLCLTWNVYLHEGEKTLIEQCEALHRDFTHCLLYLQKGSEEVVSKYFPKVQRINNNLFYFSK